MADVTVEFLRLELRRFAEERDWEKYHSPKNLASAVASEAGELLAHFRWMSEQDSCAIEDSVKEKVSEEVADTFIFLIRLSDRLGIDLIDVATRKIALNRSRYPAELVKGSAKKYTEY